MYTMWIYFVWLSGFVVVGIYFSSCLTFRFLKTPKWVPSLIVVAIGSITLYFKAKYTYDINCIEYNIANTVQTFIFIIYILVCFKDAMWKKILIYILSLVTACIAEVEVRILSSVVGTPLDFYFNDFTTVKYMIFCAQQQSMWLMLVAWLWKKALGKSMQLSKAGFMLLFPISQIMVFYYCIKTVYSNDIYENIPGIVALLISVIADIVIFYLLVNLNEKEYLENQLKEKEQLRALEAVRFEELETKREAMAKFRHDYNNQLTTALLLEEQGNGEMAKKMIKQLREKI